eukprot:385307_1
METQHISTSNYTEANLYGEWYTNYFIENFINTNVNLHGALLYSCHSHCGEYNHINVSNLFAANSIQMFYHNNLTHIYQNTYLILQNKSFPCKGCCFPDYIVPANVTICYPNNEECNPGCDT